MNENENRIKPQAPDTETEIADEKLEDASGGDGRFSKASGLCLSCKTKVQKITEKCNRYYYYCPTCRQKVSAVTSATC